MNILPLLLGLFAWQMLDGKNKKSSAKTGGGNNSSKNPGAGIFNDLFSNPEALASLANVSKLFEKDAGQDEKSAALFSLLSNPAVLELARQFFSSSNMFNQHGGGKKDGEGSRGEERKESEKTREKESGEPCENSTPSEEAREIFKPVSTIAGVEISNKLYRLYDNWYLK